MLPLRALEQPSQVHMNKQPERAFPQHACPPKLTQNLNRLLLSLHDVAGLIGCHVRTIRRMIDNREIKAVRVRARWMICREDLEDYISNRPTNLR